MTKARDLANASTALSAVSATELGYLDGVTSAVQTQIDTKAAYPTQTGNSGKYLTTDGTNPFWGTVTLATGAVTSTMIADGTILDADINASAAIAQSKVSGLTTDLAAKAPLTIPNDVKGGAYTVVAGDNGRLINISTGGVTVATTTAMSAGQNFVIYNNSGSGQTITQGSGATLRLSGTATTGNRTLAQYGVATVLCVNTDTYIISGTGLS